jgi:hypothetical protein
MYSLQHEELPDRVTVKVEELNERVSLSLPYTFQTGLN